MNVAVLGVKGHHGAALEGTDEIDGARLCAVSDEDEGKLARVKDWEWSDALTKTYRSHDELLDSEKVDVAVVSGTDGERAGVLLSCIERGINIVSEKPLTMTLDELEQVRKGLAEGKVLLTMLLTMRTSPHFLALRRAVQEGLVGEVCLATVQKSYKLGTRPEWQKNPATFSGIIPFIGIHALDLIRWATGREFKEIAAYQSNVGHPQAGGMEDNATVLVKLDNGGTASARLDYCRPPGAHTHGDDRLRIAGQKAVVEAREGKAVLIDAKGVRELAPPGRELLLPNFARALEGRNELLIPTEDAFRMTEIVLCARESARVGVHLPV